MFIPTAPACGSVAEHDDLRRAWADLLPGLPPIDDWTVTEQLPDIDELGQGYLDYAEIAELNRCMPSTRPVRSRARTLPNTDSGRTARGVVLLARAYIGSSQ